MTSLFLVANTDVKQKPAKSYRHNSVNHNKHKQPNYMKTKLFTLLFAVAISVTNLFAASVVLPATLDVTNVSFRSEDMPDFVIEDGTYLDMGAHDSANDTLLYAEWDVTIQSIKYDVAVNVYNTNSWSVQLYVLNMVGDTVKDLRYKGTSGMKGRVAIGSWDLSDLEAGNYKVRVHAATAWSAMKLKEVIFDGTVASGTCGAEGDNVTWVLGIDGVLKISGSGAMADYDQGSNYAPWYDNRNDIRQVVVEAGVTSIGDNAFVMCEELSSLDLPEGLESIGTMAFFLCKQLSDVTFPSTLTTIESEAFNTCENFTHVLIPKTLTNLSRSAFGNHAVSIVVEEGHPMYDSRNNCNAIIITATNTLLLGCRNTIIPDDVVTIGYAAFGASYWVAGIYETITIPNSVVTIEDFAFDGRKMSSIVIPASVRSIGMSAFMSCDSLISIEFKGYIPPQINNDNGGCFWARSDMNVIVPCGAKEAYYSMLNNGIDYEIIHLSQIQETLSQSYSVSTSSELQGSVQITQAPSSCSDMTLSFIATPAEDYHFVQWSDGNTDNPRTLILGHDTVLTAEFSKESSNIIASGYCGAEGDSTNLSWVLTNNGVLTISGSGAMAGFSSGFMSPWYNSKNILRVIIENGVTNIGGNVFSSCSEMIAVDIPLSVTDIGNQAFAGCSALKNINLPNSITRIGSSAFSGCSGLTSFVLPSSVTNIEVWAFNNCCGLESIAVEEGNSTFDCRNNCNAIIETSSNTLVVGCKNTIIPNSVTTIGKAAFEGNSNLTSISIPNSVTSIDPYAFIDCINLTSIVIPRSVKNIGIQVFDGAYGLESIVVEEGNTKYDSRENCNAIIETSTNKLIEGCKNTIIPNSVTEIGLYAFFKHTGLTNIIIPDSVTNIGMSAFAYCTALTEITIPDNVTNIEYSAFYNCTNLTKVTIGSGIKNITGAAFYVCGGITDISCKATTPPACESTTFQGVDKTIPLHVPSRSIAAYKAADVWKEFTNIQAIPGTEGSGTTPPFPGDPGTITYKLQLGAAVIGGDSLPEWMPTGAGGYAAGTEVVIMAQDIPGYQFVQWSDSVTEQSRTVVVNQSTSLTALYNRKQIEIAVAANAWTFFCLPAIGKEYTEEMFEYVGLSNVKWGTYNGATRAAGKSGWETPESYNAQQGYIIYSTTAGTLRINTYLDEIPQSAVSSPLSAYQASLLENSGWNFLGNPYAQGYDIAGLAAAGIESPITIWNGTGYDTYTPGIDTYILQPFEAFFIQKAEGGADTITFDPKYKE